jgi:hypothetical protein
MRTSFHKHGTEAKARDFPAMIDLQTTRQQQPELVPDVTFWREILTALLVLTVSTGGIVFALL